MVAYHHRGACIPLICQTTWCHHHREAITSLICQTMLCRQHQEATIFSIVVIAVDIGWSETVDACIGVDDPSIFSVVCVIGENVLIDDDGMILSDISESLCPLRLQQ
jgi:hypothetical protein